jgi:uncharacterized delta-60 repeat protein
MSYFLELGPQAYHWRHRLRPRSSPAAPVTGASRATVGLTTDFGSENSFGWGIVRQPDGRLVVAGVAGSDNQLFALARYKPNGALDPSFSDDGKRGTDFGPGQDAAQDIALQPDAKLVLGGFATGSTRDFAAARYHPNGGSTRRYPATARPGRTSLPRPTRQAASPYNPAGKSCSPASPRTPTRTSRSRATSRTERRTTPSPATRRQTIDFSPGGEAAEAVLSQPDGKIIAVGQAFSGYPDKTT